MGHLSDQANLRPITSKEMIAQAAAYSERLVTTFAQDDPTPVLITVDTSGYQMLTTVIPGGMYNDAAHVHMGQAVAQTIARTRSMQSALIMPASAPNEAMLVLYTQSRMNPYGAQLLHTRALVGAIDRSGEHAQIVTWSMPPIEEHGWMQDAISHGHWMAHTAAKTSTASTAATQQKAAPQP